MARLKLTGLEKGKSYDLQWQSRSRRQRCAKGIEYTAMKGVYNFQKVKADDSGSVTVRVRVRRLKPGKYDVKFFVGESNEAEKYPIVLYNNDFVFELMKEYVRYPSDCLTHPTSGGSDYESNGLVPDSSRLHGSCRRAACGRG